MEILIKIIVPKKGEKWTLNYNGGTLKRDSATKIYNTCERRLLKLKKLTKLTASLASPYDNKIKVYVDYRQVGGYDNSGEYTTAYEALYVIACFLEDYLAITLQNQKYRKYFPKFTGMKYI